MDVSGMGITWSFLNLKIQLVVRFPNQTRVRVKKIAEPEHDLEVKHKLNAMGWNCITAWECELKPAKREATLQSLVFTLNEIFNNHKVTPYKEQEVEPLLCC